LVQPKEANHVALVKNLYSQIVDQLGRSIVSGAVAPGSGLATESRMADTYGVSRVVIREAIKALAAKGMVSVGPSIGTRVLPADQWHLLDPDVLEWYAGGDLSAKIINDLIDLRRVIEPQAARFAATRAQPEDLAAIGAAYQAMVDAVGGSGDYTTADIAFHTAVLNASHNQFLCQLRAALTKILKLSFSVSAHHPDATAASLPYHQRLFDAICAGDADRAAHTVETMIARNDKHLQRMVAGIAEASEAAHS
jgi:GntR family galactonate operon transcriptional repressor